METEDSILLKWGTLKGWNLHNSPKALKALKKYNSLGVSFSVMMQNDSPEQKKLLCKMIDEVNGYIQLDWTGEIINKEAAKKYIMGYDNKRT